jgi:hypothetical protein
MLDVIRSSFELGGILAMHSVLVVAGMSNNNDSKANLKVYNVEIATLL